MSEPVSQGSRQGDKPAEADCLAFFGGHILLLTPSCWGAWPRDAAVDTHKQAGRQSTALTRASSCSCHVTKRFRILATLKQGNKSMYSNTSEDVHMGLDWTGVRASQDNRHSVPTHIPIPGPTLSVPGRGGGTNTTHALLSPDPETLPIGKGVAPGHGRVPGNQGAPRPTDDGTLCSLSGRSQLPSWARDKAPPLSPRSW